MTWPCFLPLRCVGQMTLCQNYPLCVLDSLPVRLLPALTFCG